MILLDTCSLLWLADDPSRLSGPAREVLRQPGLAVYASAFSAFELGVKVAKRKLGLPKPLKEWFAAVCAQFAVRELPLTAAIAAAATELPGLHADPADRILIATALEHHLTILTPDDKMRQYRRVRTLW
jgi:PIN domain nuclease of toxin-antitoxin system